MGKQALTSLPGIIGHFRKERVKRVEQMLPDLCPVLFVHRFLKDGLHQPVHRERARLRLIAALLEAGFAVYLVNPRTVDRRRKPSGAKTNAIDAYLLAKRGAVTWLTYDACNRTRRRSRNSKRSRAIKTR